MNNEFISKWSGMIVLPPLPKRNLEFGGNRVFQQVFEGAQTTAQILCSEFPKHDLIRTALAPPYNEILLRWKGARRIDTSLPVVTLSEITEHEAPPASLSLRWDSLGGLKAYADKPEKVLQAWLDQFKFRTEDQTVGLSGLRAPQIGALHAISAHFSVGSRFEAATVVLPTGTGKTETMLAAHVYLRFLRALVLVPSRVLRDQIGGKFISLGVLPDVGVVPKEIPRPRVAVITTGIHTIEDARSLVENANVFIALPNILKTSSSDAIAYLTDMCSDLIVDEAHHVTAKTWHKVRERFENKRIIQFTATPYRRDGKHVDGKIIFNYKLGDAQKADYYRPIHLYTVEEYGDQDLRDRVIAKEAVEILRRDRDERGLDHLLMARTQTKARAETICEIYSELAPDLNPTLVYSGTGRTAANKKALEKLLDRGVNGSRIVVCVDMLGEGFDLPNLKVAALHDTHKSLAVALQFIGRFTRKGDTEKIGEASAILNIADQNAEKKLSNLYAEGADWDHMIKRLSEERIDQEIRLQDVILKLKEKGDLHAQLSLWNLRPKLSAQFFKTTCSTWHPDKYKSVLPEGAKSWDALSDDQNILVAVVCHASAVSWGNYQNICDISYSLIILQWNSGANVLYLYASDYDALRTEKIAKTVTNESTEPIEGDPIFNILNNVKLPLVKSLGSSKVGAISFASYFGPNVTEGLARIEKAESFLNNIACLGYEDGERVVWGATQRRGKVWQHKAGTIDEWMDWTKATWAKVTSGDNLGDNITKDFLRPARIDKLYQSAPLSVQWGEQAQLRFSNRQFVVFGETEVPFFCVSLEIRSIDSNHSLGIRIVSDDVSAEYMLTISDKLPAGYSHEHVSGPKVMFRAGNKQAIPLEEYLAKDPLIVRYADGTFSYNCYHINTDLDVGTYEKERLESWDWTGIPINKESMHKSADKETIQYRTFEHLENEYDVVFNDDGCGEAADLVCLKDIDENTILLCLVHCKGAHGARVSRDIQNFYTVCGQAQKCIAVKHAGLPTLYHNLRRRQEQWARDGYTRFLKGDLKTLSYFKEKARRAKLDFEVTVVQPGASAASITDNSLRLLATTELYLFKTTQAKFRVVVSP